MDVAAWLWGWDPTPGIVAVHAERDGRALIWRRAPAGGPVTREAAQFRPWIALADLADLAHLDDDLRDERDDQAGAARATFRELAGEVAGGSRFVVSAADGRWLEAALLAGATRRAGQAISRIGDVPGALCLPPEEQYLVATGRVYFRDLRFDDLHRLQFDLETTGLNPDRDQIFLIALRDSRGLATILDVSERGLSGPAAEADLLRRFAALLRAVDPDVIENHNLHGFDLPFVARRAEILGVPLILGRAGAPGLRQRPSSRGYGSWRSDAAGDARPGRYTIPGRECIDTLDAVRRYDFVARDLPGHGLKAVARHFGLAPAGRVYLAGERVYATWLADPEAVRRYALDDVTEAGALARLLGGAAFALARMAPRRYERLADAGSATGILDPLIVRAYLREGEAIPPYATPDGRQHSGAALHLFATGVAHRVVKADVSSLYPSLMRQYRIGPAADRLGVMLALVDQLVEQRLAAKDRARAAAPGSPERYTDEAISAAIKILVNSAYGYLAAAGLTRLADMDAANEVTARGRALLSVLCREIARRGGILLEADTDGVYFAVPAGWTEADERGLVAEVATLLPPLVRLEFEGRYAAMLSHEPKNYALLSYDGAVILRGVAFRSIKFEAFANTFLRQAIGCLLREDIAGARTAYLDAWHELRRRALPSAAVATVSRLTKSPERYRASRGERREAPYEALLAAGRATWRVGESIRLYRATGGRFALLPDEDAADPRDYDVPYYQRLLRDTYAGRLKSAFSADDWATLFVPEGQPALFATPVESLRARLTIIAAPPAADES